MVLGSEGGIEAVVRRALSPACLLELPEEILKDIFQHVQAKEDAEVEEEVKERAEGTWRPDVALKIPELAAFRCTSKAAKKVADAAVELVRYQFESLQNLSDLSEQAMVIRMLAFLRVDLARWRNASRLHLLLPFRDALHSWLDTLATARGDALQELRVDLTCKKPYPARAEITPLDLPVLARFPSLQKLHLANIALNRDTLEALARLPALKQLTLKVLNLERLSLPCMPQLRELSLTGFECGGFIGYAPLFDFADASPWASLETLVFTECRLPVPWKIAPGAFPSLTSLSLKDISSESIRQLDLKPLSAVKHLSLEMSMMRRGPLPDLAPLSSLHSLNVSFFEAAGLSALVNLTTLESLSLKGLQTFFGPDEYTRWITCLPRLRTLRSDNCLAPAAVTSLTTLESLTLSQNTIRERCTGNEPHLDLGSLQGLRSLDLFLHCVSISLPGSADLGSVGMTELRGLERLKSLRAIRLRGLSLAQVPGLTSLTALQDLNATFELTPTCPRLLPWVEGLSSLHTLRLTNWSSFRSSQTGLSCPFRGVLHLAGLPLLRSLELENVEVQSIVGLDRPRNLEGVLLSGLSRLRQLPSLTLLTGLRQLCLVDLPVTEPLHLEGLTSLRTLTLSLSSSVPPVRGLEHCVGLKYLCLHRGAPSCGRWIHSLTSLETLVFHDLPFRQWLFKSRDGREMFVYSSCGGGRGAFYDMPWRPVLTALRAGGRVEKFEDTCGEDGYEEEVDESSEDEELSDGEEEDLGVNSESDDVDDVDEGSEDDEDDVEEESSEEDEEEDEESSEGGSSEFENASEELEEGEDVKEESSEEDEDDTDR